MCVYIYIYICVCLYLCLYLYLYLYLYICMVKYICICKWIYTVVSRQSPQQTSTGEALPSIISMYIYTYIYTYVYIYICTCKSSSADLHGRGVALVYPRLDHSARRLQLFRPFESTLRRALELKKKQKNERLFPRCTTFTETHSYRYTYHARIPHNQRNHLLCSSFGVHLGRVTLDARWS